MTTKMNQIRGGIIVAIETKAYITPISRVAVYCRTVQNQSKTSEISRMELMNIVILTVILVSGTYGAPNRQRYARLDPNGLRELEHIRETHGQDLLDIASSIEEFVLGQAFSATEPTVRQYASFDTAQDDEDLPPAVEPDVRSAQLLAHEQHDEIDRSYIHRLNELLEEMIDVHSAMQDGKDFQGSEY